MLIKDFLFNLKSQLKNSLKKKHYFKFFTKIISNSFKYIIFSLRKFFSIKNIDQIKLDDNIKSLDDIFIWFDCDKSSKVHGYHKFYENIFSNFLNLEPKILEFGIHHGASQASFYKYLPKANIIGVDKNPYTKKFYSNNIRSLYCDFSDKDSIGYLKSYINGKFDIIIDDASHIPIHQLNTFCEMFEVLNNNGVYIIEELDIFQSFKEYYNKNLKTEKSLIREFLYDFKINDINYLNDKYQFHNANTIIRSIKKIDIFRGGYIVNGNNVSEIALIFKK